MSIYNNLKIGVKLAGGFITIALMMIALAIVSYFNINAINNGMTELYNERTLPIQQLGFETKALYTMRGDLYKAMAIPAQQEATFKAIQTDVTNMEAQIKLYEAHSMGSDEKAEADKYQTLWTTYKNDVLAAIDTLKAGNVDSVRQSLIDGALHKSRDAAAGSLDKLIEINRAQAEGIDNQSAVTFTSSVRFLVITSLFGLLLALGLGLFLTRSLTNIIHLLVKTAEQIAQNDLPALESATAAIAGGDLTKTASVQTQTLLYDAKDEMGDLARAFNAMITRLQSVGANFIEMSASLSSLVGHVAENAASLTSASAQLASASTQAGQATSQISATIQQVAAGISQQTDSASRTAASVDQMGQAIDSVARGAQDQSLAVAKASNVANQINAAIQEVTASAETSAKGANQAANTARSGAKTVEDTISGMKAIKDKVGLSAMKVQEMGKRSNEIGAIVETIDDIASQTNLLALNAAIEAARAGEHGKGFAVVADEVRKLAERSSSATKEIGKLIRGIQQTMAEAVTAMDEGTREVENGVARASQSDEALDGILEAVELVKVQVEQIAIASQRINASSGELVAAVDAVSAVVEENTAVTEQMLANSSVVTSAVENIASVSEENSASVEEVSASTEEMTAQVEEVSASAQSLAEMAQNLQGLVSRFKLDQRYSSQAAVRVVQDQSQGMRANGKSNGHSRNGEKPTLMMKSKF